uniref:ABM domain-containing protein n=1 Tax=Syphacia muris TaxID=451379 RepID=A0A0N5AGR0_9BILA
MEEIAKDGREEIVVVRWLKTDEASELHRSLCDRTQTMDRWMHRWMGGLLSSEVDDCILLARTPSAFNKLTN